MDGALTSDVDRPMIVQPDRAPELETITKEAEQFASVFADPKWRVIEEHIASRIDHYRNALGGADLRGIPLAEVGEKYLVSNLVAMEFEGLLDKVRVVAEGVNEAKRAQ